MTQESSATAQGAGASSTRSSRASSSGALAAFDALINGGAGKPPAPPSRRQLDPDSFAVEYAQRHHERSARREAFVLEPGRKLDELDRMELCGELLDGATLGRMFRARLASMICAVETPQDLAQAARAMRHAPAWAIESPEEREERINAIAGFSVEETRRMRREAQTRLRKPGEIECATAKQPQPANDPEPASLLAVPGMPPQPGSPDTAGNAGTAINNSVAPALNRTQRRRLEALEKKRVRGSR